MNAERGECCVEFEPGPWEDKEIVWENKRFVTDWVWHIFHISLNFGAVMKRNVAKIEAADALPEDMSEFIVFSDCGTFCGMNVFMTATKDVPDAKMATISGTFLSKVFEGPYKNMGTWIKQMKEYVAGKGRELKKMYFYYTTCPKCAKKYGKNYVVLLAQV